MVSAVEAVKRGMSVLRAATLHGVPRTTLQNRVKGRVKHGDKPGPNTYLTPAEEEELASFLMEVARVGYGKTRREVKLLVEAVAREKGVLRGERISDGWFRRFLERRPNVSLRRGDATANVRMEALDMEKRQREILKKKKKEEKAAKAEERRKRQAVTAGKRSRQPTAQKARSKKARLDVSTSTGDCSTSATAAVKQTTGKRSDAKGKQKASGHSGEEININQCAICFRTYNDDIQEETGEVWIECACGRWVHENCVDYDVVVDARGKERVCPHCVL